MPELVKKEGYCASPSFPLGIAWRGSEAGFSGERASVYRLEEVEVEHLAKIAHMSLSNFHRVLTQTMAKPAKEYKISKRINCSCEMLSSTELSISDIAYESGFNKSLLTHSIYLMRYVN